jgi:hypothetical protein
LNVNAEKSASELRNRRPNVSVSDSLGISARSNLPHCQYGCVVWSLDGETKFFWSPLDWNWDWSWLHCSWTTRFHLAFSLYSYRSVKPILAEPPSLGKQRAAQSSCIKNKWF